MKYNDNFRFVEGLCLIDGREFVMNGHISKKINLFWKRKLAYGSNSALFKINYFSDMLCFIQSRYSPMRIYLRHRHKPADVGVDGRLLEFRSGIFNECN